jgi:hypothetical protein
VSDKELAIQVLYGFSLVALTITLLWFLLFSIGVFH